MLLAERCTLWTLTAALTASTAHAGAPLGHVEMRGTGPTPVVLIAGLACDWTVWDAFMSRNGDQYTMYAVTLPGAPVDTSAFRVSAENDGSYLVVSALVPYKRIDLAILACQKLGRTLKIVGTGPDEDKLRSKAGPEVRFLGWMADADLARLYRQCRAVLFPGVEDFGIVPLEAMASGKPVVAFGKGGALETIIDGTTGIFFNDQSVEGLTGAMTRLEQMNLDPIAIRHHAEGFDRGLFSTKLQSLIHRITDAFSPAI